MGNDRNLSDGAHELYQKFTTYANGGKTIDLTMKALGEMRLTLRGVFIAYLIELQDAGLIRYHVNDIPSIEILH